MSSSEIDTTKQAGPVLDRNIKHRLSLLSPIEQSHIVKALDWLSNGISEEQEFPDDPVYVALIAARAENYIMAIRAGDPAHELAERHALLHNLLSARTVLMLAKSWLEQHNLLWRLGGQK